MNKIFLREHNKAERRKAILAAAREIVREEGIDELSMRKLAARAGVNVRTIYNLIGGQGEVLGAIVNEMLLAVMTAVATVPADAPIERMRQMSLAPVRLLLGQPELYKPALRVSERTPGCDSHALYEKDCIAQLKKELRRAVRQGILLDSMAYDRVAQHMYQNGARAMNDWAYGAIPDKEFFLRVMDGFYLTLAAVAIEERRGDFLDGMKRQKFVTI